MVNSPSSMTGKVCIVSGANSGIGLETARGLAAEGATVVMGCRNMVTGDHTLHELMRDTSNACIDLIKLDLGALDSVKAFVEQFVRRYNRLDLLVNNAGLASTRRELTADGFESTFGINHLGPFLLTNLLLNLIRKSAPARIVNVSSLAHYDGQLDFDDLQSQHGYKTMKAYSASKLANILFTKALARRLEDSGVTVNALHPGVVGTNIWRSDNFLYQMLCNIAKMFMLSARKGAETSLYLAMSPDVAEVTGRYFDACREKAPAAKCEDVILQERLWRVSEELVGLRASAVPESEPV